MLREDDLRLGRECLLRPPPVLSGTAMGDRAAESAGRTESLIGSGQGIAPPCVDDDVTDADGVRPGDTVTVEVTYAAPHHLVADGPVLAVRRTRAGDAWARRASPAPSGVALGMPTLGAPAPLPEAPACG